MRRDTYFTILAGAESEFTEKRSRFLCALAPLKTEEEASAFLTQQRTRHRDASHHCSAYILRHNNIVRCSDDGEPQGTAGVPMLEVLKREGLTDIMAVVIRYYGGINLGAGGLSRAYSHSVKLAVDAAVRVRMVICASFMLELPYAMHGKAQALLQNISAEILDSGFTDIVTIRARLPSDEMPRLQKELSEISGGAVAPQIICEDFAPDRRLMS